MHAFYINLDRHPERRAYLETQLRIGGIEAERVPGVDGNKVPADLVPYYDLNGTASDALRPNQIGCHSSHMKVLQLIVERDLDYALVLEDDATLPPGFGKQLEEIVQSLPAQWDLVRLCRESKAAVRPLKALSGGHHLVRYSRVPLGNAGSLVSRSGARKILTPRRVQNPSDKEISQAWLLNLDVYGVEPNPMFQERVALPSTIGDDRGGLNRFRRMLMAPTKFRYNISKLGIGWWLRCCAENAIMKLRLRARGKTRAARLNGQQEAN